jgi:uncharacterized protein (DUF2141 family)
MLNLLIILLSSILVSPSNGETLTIEVQNVKSDKGMVRIVLFDDDKGFPEDLKKSIKIINKKATKGKLLFKIENLQPGTYAFALLHDENENGKMDYNMVGYPKEGWAVSNNAKPTLRAPRYEEAAFEFDKNKSKQEININY